MKSIILLATIWSITLLSAHIDEKVLYAFEKACMSCPR